MVVCDAVIRKLPGALGHEDSAVEESFGPALGGAPEYPHYTRPAEWRGHDVPECCSPATTPGSASGGSSAEPSAARDARPSAPRLVGSLPLRAARRGTPPCPRLLP